MLERIQEDMKLRMKMYTDSRFPTDDEVTICWLLMELELTQQKLKEAETKLLTAQA